MARKLTKAEIRLYDEELIARTEAHARELRPTRSLGRRACEAARAMERPETPGWSPVPGLLGVVVVTLVIVALVLTHGCVPPEAIEHAEIRAAGMVGATQLDGTPGPDGRPRQLLPMEARMIAASAAEFFAAQYRILTGNPLDISGIPLEVLQAMEAEIAAAPEAHCPKDGPPGVWRNGRWVQLGKGRVGVRGDPPAAASQHCGCPAAAGHCVMPCDGCCDPVCPCTGPPSAR